jgi:hypothetical protein
MHGGRRRPAERIVPPQPERADHPPHRDPVPPQPEWGDRHAHRDAVASGWRRRSAFARAQPDALADGGAEAVADEGAQTIACGGADALEDEGAQTIAYGGAEAITDGGIADRGDRHSHGREHGDPVPRYTEPRRGRQQGQEQGADHYGWILVLVLLILAIAIALLVLRARRRKAQTAWTTPATNAYRSCSELRDRLARELTTTEGSPWAQLLPLVDGTASTLYPLQTSPPDQQAALTVTHTVEALSAVRLALQTGAATPTPSEEAKASLLRALGQLDTALEPLRFEATGRSGPKPMAGA